MGLRGPAPLPSAARKARGDSRKIGRKKLEQLGAEEPQAPPGIPDMPAVLSAGAKEEWERLVPELAAIDGLLSRIDADALTAYCEDLATLRSLREQHQRLGNVGREIRQHEWITERAERDGTGRKEVETRCALCGAAQQDAKPTCPTGKLYLNPVLKEIDVLEARCMLHRREFGMTPSARTRVTVAVQKEKPKNPFSDLAAEAPSSARTETTAPAFSYVAVANQYARDVAAGRLLACKWVRLACQRHLDDLARAKKGWHYVFDEAKANHVCRFIECLPHTKGDWASRGERLRLQPWQVFILCVVFGWLKRASRTRRFSLAYILVPRKNGKSIIAGGIGNYMLAADGEFGAEIYSGATTEKQAWEVFRPARDMVLRTPELQEAFGITVGAKRLFIESNGSRFEPVIGKPGDGASPHCGIVDE